MTKLLSYLPLLTACLLLRSLAAFAQDHAPYGTLGPHYKVVWNATPPEVYWDREPAPGQLTITTPGLGYVVDAEGAPQLVLDWRDEASRLKDRAYCGESFFTWALQQVKQGQSFDPDEFRRRSAIRTGAAEERATAWTGERVVALSNPGHELRFVVTPEGATATDNGRPVEVSGGEGNYRVYAEDYECGVSVQADGYVYHYYRPR